MEGTKAKQTRRHLSEPAWRALIERFDGAALTVEAFCEREGVCRSSFGRWRSRLRATPKPATQVRARPSAADAAQGSFVDLGLLGTTGPVQPAGLDLCIELGGGIVLHLVRR